MPEIAEVESVSRMLNDYYNNSLLSDIETFNKTHLRGLPRGIKIDANAIIGAKIIRFYRIGKYIIAEFDNNTNLVTHLMMSGKFMIDNSSYKHMYVKLTFDNKNPLFFFDQRRFSIMKTCNNIQNLNKGIDALNSNITADILLKIFTKDNKQIKVFLLQSQEKIVGIGNIYACEILWHAKIDPFKICSNINYEEADRLANAISFILNRAVHNGGSTLDDKGYILPDGSFGNAQNFHTVYAKKGQKCQVCQTIICKIIQNTRGTFYCPSCQSNKIDN